MKWKIKTMFQTTNQTCLLASEEKKEPVPIACGYQWDSGMWWESLKCCENKRTTATAPYDKKLLYKPH
jgi:hypothetical protein